MKTELEVKYFVAGIAGVVLAALSLLFGLMLVLTPFEKTTKQASLAWLLLLDIGPPVFIGLAVALFGLGWLIVIRGRADSSNS